MKTILRVLLFATVAALAAIQSAAATTGDWPQWGFNAHGRHENTHDVAGNLYGTTSMGGVFDSGTIFAIER